MHKAYCAAHGSAKEMHEDGLSLVMLFDAPQTAPSAAQCSSQPSQCAAPQAARSFLLLADACRLRSTLIVCLKSQNISEREPQHCSYSYPACLPACANEPTLYFLCRPPAASTHSPLESLLLQATLPQHVQHTLPACHSLCASLSLARAAQSRYINRSHTQEHWASTYIPTSHQAHSRAVIQLASRPLCLVTKAEGSPWPGAAQPPHILPGRACSTTARARCGQGSSNEGRCVGSTN